MRRVKNDTKSKLPGVPKLCLIAAVDLVGLYSKVYNKMYLYNKGVVYITYNNTI